jgi:hypothetical protein
MSAGKMLAYNLIKSRIVWIVFALAKDKYPNFNCQRMVRRS